MILNDVSLDYDIEYTESGCSVSNVEQRKVLNCRPL